MRIFGDEDASIYKLIVFPTNDGVKREEELSTDEGFI
jgi:hypothetical protein